MKNQILQDQLENRIQFNTSETVRRESQFASARHFNADLEEPNANELINNPELTRILEAWELDPLALYQQVINRNPLLTAEQETELAEAMERGKRARARLRDKQTSSSETKRLQKLVRAGEQARHELIQANFRLVFSIANKYRNAGIPISDLVQEGNIGLIKAADKFEYKRGFRFSTYATWWIRQSVQRAVADQARTIRLPVHLAEKVNKMVRISQELTQELGHAPSSEELAARMGTTPARIDHLIKVSQKPTSLETPIGEDEDASFGDLLADEESLTPVEAVAHNLLTAELEQALGSLTPREERILRLRYGLNDGRVHTLEEVGEKMGYTRERIRQLEAGALRKLRHPSRSRTLRGYLDRN